MLLTRECDYAIRVVRALSDFQITPVKTICEREHIPQQFAYKILKKMEQSGFVLSHRGARGGYQLAKKLSTITLFDIVSVIDDKLFINECLYPGKSCPNHSDEEFCGVHYELVRIQAILVDALCEKTIDEVV